MIVLGLDYGEKRIGVAVSDALGIAAHGAPDFLRDGTEMDRIAAFVVERGVGRVVVGLPLRMDGTQGPAAYKVRSFMKDLRQELGGVEVVPMDERLTSAQAHRVLSEMGANMRTRRREVDRMAAQIILQRYLDREAARRSGGGGGGAGEDASGAGPSPA